MIDTIIIRLHGLRKYRLLIKRLKMSSDKSGFKTETGALDTEELENLRKAHNPQQVLRIMRLNKTGQFLARTASSKKMNASNHFAFSFYEDFTNDYIEFNFSVPKYRYGSNVLMFVEHSHDRDFKLTENSSLKHNIKNAPGMIMRFLDCFLRNEFPLDKVDYKDVEINRIDVCFNQVFQSKEAALLYLKYQKRITKKYSREEETEKTVYPTSFMHKSQRSSSKIYHKGAEYKKNDRKEHLKINEEKGFQYFRVDHFQQLADRILRYEITIRNSELNYLYKHNEFRKNDLEWHINYKNYQRISNTKKRNERISKSAGLLPEKERDEYLNLHPYEMVSKNDKETYKYVSHLIECSPKFMLEIDEASKTYNTKTIPGNTVGTNSNTALFSKQLIWLCLKKLYGFIKEFQLDELPDEEVVGILIDRYNLSHTPKLSKADMLQFYLKLVTYGSFKEAAIHSRYSRPTLYRYKSKFKAIGITERSIRPQGSNSVPIAAINLKEYHYFLLYKHDLLRGLKIF